MTPSSAKKSVLKQALISQQIDQQINPSESAPKVLQLQYPPLKSIDLAPQDWLWATWRDFQPLPRPEPRRFNLNDCLQRFQKIGKELRWQWNWPKAQIAPNITPAEAHFWLVAMLSPADVATPQEISPWLANQSFTGQVDPAIISADLSRYLPAEAIIIYQTLFGLADIAKHPMEANIFHDGFRYYVLPYLSIAERDNLRQAITPQLNKIKFSTDYYKAPPRVVFLGALIGMKTELEILTAQLPENFYNGREWSGDHYHQTQRVIFGFQNVAAVQTEMARLRLYLHKPEYAKAWLAHTEYAALDYLKQSITMATDKSIAAELLEVLALVKAPEAAPHMLELLTSSKAPQVARQWLNDYPEQGIAGLIPLVLGRNKLAEAAIDYLRSQKRKGHADYIQACLVDQESAVRDRVTELILNYSEKIYEPFTTSNLPKALAASLPKPTKIVWIDPVDLPPITINDHCLNPEQIQAVLTALKQSKPEPHIAIGDLKLQCDPISLDGFGWKLFESWLATGAPSKENWALLAVGWLGDDTSALKLAPLIRTWPGESQHARAVMGLECLREIGTDTALMQINGIAQKVKFQGIKTRAKECMEAIAVDRRMSRDELEDRIVPDCGLDERGSRVLDFGDRQFRLVLGDNLKPMIKDADNKLTTDLPKPNSKDDPTKAAEAIADWKLLKKQIAEVVKIQTPRLEQAMVRDRRWSIKDFEALLVGHPLMLILSQRLLWASYSADGKLTNTFRVTEDRSYANSHDDIYQLSNVSNIGIVHPLSIPELDKNAWGEIFSDYNLIQPFPQLGRPVYTLDTNEMAGVEITRFKNIKIPIIALVRTLESLGWQRSGLHDHGDYSMHCKYFPAAQITAVIGEYEQVFVNLSVDIGDGLEAIDGCCFVKGEWYGWDYPASRGSTKEVKLIQLPEVNSIVLSEVLADLHLLMTKQINL
jgi:Domain of unknown function (DUF4132)